ncbi:hypothetical protein [Teredinibacter turnerae]|uniref:hypothetical protein n=1 Tax=Teredinibacter turnerae TaxID=2426 RepID=UPI0012BD3017|nr:hypothetical protein [Teredinibacter turnerae]
MKEVVLKLCFLSCLALSMQSAYGEQTFVGDIKSIHVNNYSEGAAYIFIEGSQFNECQNPTNWCAIDFSLPAANQMYSTVLAAKMAGKPIRMTSNGCWSANYARCWKVTID